MSRVIHMKNILKMTSDGFTLVELMIVVAIIGVLASIAVPQYSKFQAKSRQSEVKIQLGATYTVEQSFAAENSTYSACLGQIGYNRDGTKFYYTMGFKSGVAAGTANCGPGAAVGNCLNTQWSYTGGAYAGVASAACTDIVSSTFFVANISEPTSPAGVTSAINVPTVQDDLKNTAIDPTSFVIGGAGKILSKANNVDLWTIDNNKQILNITSGLN